MAETCVTCSAKPPKGLLSCRAERPALTLCAPCYSSHVRVVHDGDYDEQQVEDTEAWRQANIGIRRSGGVVVGWFLLERPLGETSEDEDDWFCIAFTEHEADALAWQDPPEDRKAMHVEVSRKSDA